MSYVYIRTEPGLWTAGFYGADGRFEPESDHGSPREASQRVSWLNGGSGTEPGTEDNEIAEMVHSLGERTEALEQRINAVLEQQGLSTTKLGKLDRTVETLIDEQVERLPVEGKDFLGEGPEHFHTPDSQACWGKDCFTAVADDLGDQMPPMELPAQLRVEALLAILNQPAFTVDGRAAFRLLAKLPDFADGYYDAEGVAEVRLWGGVQLGYDGEQWVQAVTEASVDADRAEVR